MEEFGIVICESNLAYWNLSSINGKFSCLQCEYAIHTFHKTCPFIKHGFQQAFGYYIYLNYEYRHLLLLGAFVWPRETRIWHYRANSLALGLVEDLETLADLAQTMAIFNSRHRSRSDIIMINVPPLWRHLSQPYIGLAERFGHSTIKWWLSMSGYRAWRSHNQYLHAPGWYTRERERFSSMAMLIWLMDI